MIIRLLVIASLLLVGCSAKKEDATDTGQGGATTPATADLVPPQSARIDLAKLLRGLKGEWVILLRQSCDSFCSCFLGVLNTVEQNHILQTRTQAELYELALKKLIERYRFDGNPQEPAKLADDFTLQQTAFDAQCAGFEQVVRATTSAVTPSNDHHRLVYQQALEVLMPQLDVGSSYSFEKATAKEYGFGLEFAYRTSYAFGAHLPYLEVIWVADCSPFRNQAGELDTVVPGTRITKINDRLVSDFTLDDDATPNPGEEDLRLDNQLYFSAAKKVKFTVVGGNEEAGSGKDLTHEAVKCPKRTLVPVNLDDELGIIYIKIRDFLQGDLDQRFFDTLTTLGTSGKSVGAYILDLRGNPGGRLDVARNMLSAFIDEGELFYRFPGAEISAEDLQALAEVRKLSKEELEQRSAEERRMQPEIYRAEQVGFISRRPVFTMIDDHTASIAETFAAALTGRGATIGNTSTGKGIGQRLFQIVAGNNVYALEGHLVVSAFRVLPALGRGIHVAGLGSEEGEEDGYIDIYVEEPKLDDRRQDWQEKELEKKAETAPPFHRRLGKFSYREYEDEDYTLPGPLMNLDFGFTPTKKSYYLNSAALQQTKESIETAPADTCADAVDYTLCMTQRAVTVYLRSLESS